MENIFDEYPKLKEIPKDKFPRHILIIPDGNGRWAKLRGKFVLEGHKKGAEVVKKIIRDISEIEEIEIVTWYGFSSDNWKRSRREVMGLMKIIEGKVRETLEEVKEKKKRFIHLGRKDRISNGLAKILKEAEEETKQNTNQTLCLAIDFGGEDQEIRLLEKAKNLEKDREITNDLLWELRDGQGKIRSADLLIRTSGEKRTSDIGWLNGAPTELYFIDKFFPDVTTSDIIDAIVDFSKRERRLGGRSK